MDEGKRRRLIERLTRLGTASAMVSACEGEQAGGDRSRSKERVFVRFEDANGEGLFRAAAYMFDYFDFGGIRVNRKTKREVFRLRDELWRHTPMAARSAYIDRRSRFPITWYFQSATEALRAAEELVRVLNRYGAGFRRIETRNPPTVLWEDRIQAVTRRLRSPDRSSQPDVLEVRWANRRKRQQRRRQRAGRWQARAAKAAF